METLPSIKYQWENKSVIVNKWSESTSIMVLLARRVGFHDYDHLNSNMSYTFQHLLNGTLNLPAPTDLPKQPGTAMPYVFVADDAFPMGRHLQKPYGLTGIGYDERIFNYRLSRARRISENVFGILASRFRLFLGCIYMLPRNIRFVVMAAVTLHNILRSRNPRRYLPACDIDQENMDGTIRRGQWRQTTHNLADMDICKQRNPTVEAKKIRQHYTTYFANYDPVPWQDRVLEVGRRRTINN